MPTSLPLGDPKLGCHVSGLNKIIAVVQEKQLRLLCLPWILTSTSWQMYGTDRGTDAPVVCCVAQIKCLLSKMCDNARHFLLIYLQILKRKRARESGKEFVLICHAARGSSVPYRIYIVYRTVSGVETTVSLRSRASCRTQFQFQLACKCGYQSQVVETERGEAAQKGAQKMAQNGSQQQGQQQQQELRWSCCNNKGQNYKAKKYLQPHHYCCCCRCSCCCCSFCCCACSCCSCSFPCCCCCCCSTIVWLLGSARTFCKRRTLFPFAFFRSHHTQLSCPARLFPPRFLLLCSALSALCPAPTAGNCLTNAASFAPSLWFELPPRCLLIIWQMSWGPKQQHSNNNNEHRHLFDRRKKRRGGGGGGVAAYDGFNGPVKCIGHESPSSSSWLTFSAVLLCDLFDNHLRSLPTVPAPPALPPHSLQLLKQWALRGKTRKVVVLFPAEVFLRCFSFGMQSEPHAKWVPISFVYSECN